MPPKKAVIPKKTSGENEEGTHESDMLSGLAASPSADTAAVLAAIGDMSRKMDERFNALQSALSENQAMLEEHDGRLFAVESATSDHDGRLAKLEQQAARFEEANKALQDKVTDLEARSRRQNIKFVNLPENVEAGNPVDFVSKLMPSLFGPEHFSKPVEVDRAHRLGSQAARSANRPRILIARIHNYRVKELIMRLAIEQSPLMYQGHRIHIFPDFPAEIMRRRQLFEDSRQKIRAAGHRTGFIYPARLRVTHGNVTTTFNTPEEARIFVDSLRRGEED